MSKPAARATAPALSQRMLRVEEFIRHGLANILSCGDVERFRVERIKRSL
jgi:hypothetical protein